VAGLIVIDLTSAKLGRNAIADGLTVKLGGANEVTSP
jgi:hypothetical protein